MENKKFLFKLELDIAYPQICIASKYFHSLKILNQWLKRNSELVFLEHRKYILTEKGYERFEIFGNTIVALSQLKEVVRAIEKSEKENIEFAQHLKNKSIQNKKNEE